MSAVVLLRRASDQGVMITLDAGRLHLQASAPPNCVRGTVIFTNASAAMKGFPRSGAFAMACHAKAGLAQSIARELMPQGVHVAHVPIDAVVWLETRGR